MAPQSYGGNLAVLQWQFAASSRWSISGHHLQAVGRKPTQHMTKLCMMQTMSYTAVFRKFWHVSNEIWLLQGYFRQ